MGTIFLLMVGSLALGKRSFHQIDLFARQQDVRGWLGSDRAMVASDCTLWRVLPRMNHAQLREELQQAHALLRQQGQATLQLPGGRKIRAVAVDGSVLAGRYSSVVEPVGAGGAALDLEPCAGRGKELPTSETVLRRVFARHGRALADIVLGDGLYLTAPMLKLCRHELGTHLLVKTTELETLNILKDAEAIFQSEEFAADVAHVSGTDAQRGMAHEIWAAPGFHHAGYEEPLKVARGQITMLKGPRQGQTERFWIVTSDETLSAEQMRELAHLRWTIEIVTACAPKRAHAATNHTFRALNAAANSKHVWTREKQADQTWEALMLVMFLAFTPVLAYHSRLDPETLSQILGIRYVTLGYLMECWLLSLPTAAGLFSPSG
jgi:hypothetical protein